MPSRTFPLTGAGVVPHPAAAGAVASAQAKHSIWSSASAVTALSAALFLAGCASQGPAHTPLGRIDAQAAGLQDTSTALVTSNWWTALGDTQLNQLIEQALQGSPSLAVSRARQERAWALAEATSTNTRPHGSLSADASREHYSANGLVPAPVAGNTYNSANLQANVSWSPDFFGRYAAELNAALGQARSAQADAAAASNNLAAQVGRSYVALARLIAQRTVAERTLEQRNELLRLTQSRLSAGLDSNVELTQAQAALPDTRAQIEALDEQITLARRMVAVLCGQAPQAQDSLSPQLSQLQIQNMPTTLGTDLLGRRPDVVAARWRVEAATQDVAVARTDFYPDISLTAFIGLNSLGFNNLLQGSSRQLSVAPALRLPLFDGKRLRAQLGGKQAELDASIAQYNGAVLDAVKEAGDALASVQSISRQVVFQTEATTKAEQAYDFATQRYRAGLGNYLVVLNTESQVLNQRRLAVDLRARELDTRVQLFKALGGGWNEEAAGLNTAAR